MRTQLNPLLAAALIWYIYLSIYLHTLTIALQSTSSGFTFTRVNTASAGHPVKAPATPAQMPAKNEINKEELMDSCATGKKLKRALRTASKTKNLVMMKGTSRKSNGSKPSYNPPRPVSCCLFSLNWVDRSLVRSTSISSSIIILRMTCLTLLLTSHILFPTVKNPPKGKSVDEDMTRIRTASKGQVMREVMIVANAEAPKMMGISKTSEEPGPTLYIEVKKLEMG